MKLNNSNLNPVKRAASIAFLLASSLTLVACSDDSSDSGSPSEKLEPLTYFKIIDHNLYEFDPESGDMELIAGSDENKSVVVNSERAVVEDSLNFTTNTLPEHFVYVETDDRTNTKELKVFEFELRRTATLYTPEDGLSICGLKTLRIADPALLNVGVTKEIDSPGVSFYTTTDATCDIYADDVQFRFTEIAEDFNESEDFTVYEPIPAEECLVAGADEIPVPTEKEVNLPVYRRVVLTDYQHPDCALDDDGNPVEQVATEITVRGISGRTSFTERAFYNSNKTIIDAENDQFGVLGYDEVEEEIGLYLGNADSGVVDHFTNWTQDLPRFEHNDTYIAPNFYTSDGEYSTDEDFLIIENGWGIHYFNFPDLFDDDLEINRLLSLNNPVYTRTEITDYLPTDFSKALNATADFVINDNQDIYFIDSINPSDLLFNVPSDPLRVDTNYSDVLMSSNLILALKENAADMSLVYVNLNGVELTIQTTIESISLGNRRSPSETIFYNTVDTTQSIPFLTKNTQALNSSFTKVFSEDISNAITYESNDNTSSGNPIVIAKGTEWNEDEPTAQINSLIFSFDVSQQETELPSEDADDDNRFSEQFGEGELVVQLTDAIAEILDITFISANHGEITVRPSLDSDRFRTYYFNPSYPFSVVDNDDATFSKDLVPAEAVLIFGSETTELPTE